MAQALPDRNVVHTTDPESLFGQFTSHKFQAVIVEMDASTGVFADFCRDVFWARFGCPVIVVIGDPEMLESKRSEWKFDGLLRYEQLKKMTLTPRVFSNNVIVVEKPFNASAFRELMQLVLPQT